MLGASVRDASGRVKGRIREIAVAPQDHATRVAFLIVRTADGERVLPSASVKAAGATVRAEGDAGAWEAYAPSDGVLLLKRDLLDQQIIDVHGRKVVRVNDVELDSTPVNSHVMLDVVSVDVGARGAIRRLAKGLVPSFTLRALLTKIPPRVIPWQYVDLIETDPARRVKLKIAYTGLSRMHPADIADIVEDLPPAEQKAVFEALDEEVAAEALEEIDPDVQVSIVESLDSNRAADIVEEMDPAAAADLLDELTEDRSGEILSEMDAEERQEVSQLLEFSERTAARWMTTEFIAIAEHGTVSDAVEALRSFEGAREAVATIYLIGPAHTLVGSVPLVRIATSAPTTRLALLREEVMSCPPDTPDDEVAEIFDKYNLLTLAVVDHHGRMAGIIPADDVIAMLRHER
jgi:CBS domain-containing protein